MDFKEEIVKILAGETKLPREQIISLLSVPPDSKLGDYAFPCFKLGGNPIEQAKKLQQKMVLSDFLSKIEAAGPYLNFFVHKSVLAQQTITAILKEKGKFGALNQKQNMVIEYCGPNTNKPLHLGHIRNMALGNAACRLIAFAGNKVHPVNIINDRGIHICQSMLAYQKWGKGKKPDAQKQASGTSVSGGKKGDHFVGDFYVKFAQELKQNADLKDEAQQMLQQWEDKDPEVRKLWKNMNQWVLKGFAETYHRFGISFEKEYFESDIYELGKEVAFEGLQKKVFIKDDAKAIVAPLESYGLGNKIVLRGDGTSVYITQDMYLAQQRYEDFKFDQLIYVVASEQQLHFKQLFKIFELLERPFARHLYHLSYGLVNLPTGRMKSREGTVVDADDFMDEISALAEKEVKARFKDLSEKEIKRRAEFIGLGAIKFFMLRTDAIRDIIFNPEESLSFEGETGPYLQYTHARASSILRKAKSKAGKIKADLLMEDSELKVITLLSQFPDRVAEVAESYKIHLLCRYLLDLAQAFNEFYHACPVISDDEELMKARVALVKATVQVLANGLDILGIVAPEEM